MILTKAYVISYISPKWDDVTKDKRRAVHIRQIEWLKQQGLDVYVFAQYKGDLDVKYLPYTRGRYLPGDARNECLKHFYSTDDDFAIFLDDDAILDPGKLENDTFISDIRKQDISDFDKVSLITPINPKYDPYTQFQLKNRQVLEDNWVMLSKPHQPGFIFFLKNLKKHHGIEIYYEEDWSEPDGSVKFGEDAVFSMRLTKAGLGSYQCWNISALDMGSSISTHSGGVQDKEVISRRMKDVKFIIQGVFPDLKIVVKPDGSSRVQWAEWADRFQRGRYVYIPKVGVDNIMGL